MSHVVGWLDAGPTVVINRRDNNKPQRRADLIRALQPCDERNIREARERVRIFKHTTDVQSIAEEASVLLQQEIFDFVLSHLAAFRAKARKGLLDEYTEDHETISYTERFSCELWSGVLEIVRLYVGGSFRPEWGRPGIAQEDTSSEAPSTPANATDAAVESLCVLLQDIPGLRQITALREKLGSTEVRTALASWLRHRSLILEEARHWEGYGELGSTAHEREPVVTQDNDSEGGNPEGTRLHTVTRDKADHDQSRYVGIMARADGQGRSLGRSAPLSPRTAGRSDTAMVSAPVEAKPRRSRDRGQVAKPGSHRSRIRSDTTGRGSSPPVRRQVTVSWMRGPKAS